MNGLPVLPKGRLKTPIPFSDDLLSLQQHNIVLFLRVSSFDCQRNRFADKVDEHRQRLRFFVEEEVDDVGRGEDAEGLHVVTAGFADDFALDFVADGLRRFQTTPALAGRAGFAEDLAEIFARALASQLDQTQAGEAVEGNAGAVEGEGFGKLLQHGFAVRFLRHVDEVDDDDAAKVAQP